MFKKIIVTYSLVFTAITLLRDISEIVGYVYLKSGSVYLVSVILTTMIVLAHKKNIDSSK
jgi:hypothetical protein